MNTKKLEAQYGVLGRMILEEFHTDFKEQLTPSKLEKLNGKALRLADAVRRHVTQQSRLAMKKASASLGICGGSGLDPFDKEYECPGCEDCIEEMREKATA